MIYIKFRSRVVVVIVVVVVVAIVLVVVNLNWSVAFLGKFNSETPQNIEKHIEKRINTPKHKKTQKNGTLGVPWHSWGALGRLLDALGALLGALGALLGALGALLGHSWALLGASWTPPGRLLDASWKKPGWNILVGAQLGGQNRPKLAPKSSKNRC